jgi:GAF domain-containing protein
MSKDPFDKPNRKLKMRSMNDLNAKSSSPYILGPPNSARDKAENARRQSEKLRLMEQTIVQLLESKSKMEATHLSVVKRLQSELVRLGDGSMGGIISPRHNPVRRGGDEGFDALIRKTFHAAHVKLSDQELKTVGKFVSQNVKICGNEVLLMSSANGMPLQSGLTPSGRNTLQKNQMSTKYSSCFEFISNLHSMSSYAGIIDDSLSFLAKLLEGETVSALMVNSRTGKLLERKHTIGNTATSSRVLENGLGIGGWAIKYGNFVAATSVSKNSLYNVRIDSYDGIEPKALLYIPLRNQSLQTIGVVKVIRGKAFEYEEVVMMNTLSTVISNNLGRLQNNVDSTVAKHQIIVACQVSQTLRAKDVSTQDAILDIVKAASDVLDAEQVNLYLKHGLTGDLELHASYPTHKFTDKMMSIVPYHVMETKSMVNTKNIHKDPQYMNEIGDEDREKRTKQVLCQCIIDSDDCCIGVIEAVNHKNDEDFAIEDEHMMQYLCNSAAVALTKTTVMEEKHLQNTRNKALRQAISIVANSNSKKVSSDQLVRSLVDIAYDLVPVERVNFYAVDEVDGGLVCKVSQDYEDYKFSSAKGIPCSVAETGETIRTADAYNHPAFDPTLDEVAKYKTRCVLALPIKDASGRVSGVMECINKKDNKAFNEDDEELLKVITLEVAVVIRSKMLDDSLKDIVAGRKASVNLGEGLSSLVNQFANPAIKKDGPGGGSTRNSIRQSVRRNTIVSPTSIISGISENLQDYSKYDAVIKQWNFNVLEFEIADLCEICTRFFLVENIVADLNLDVDVLKSFFRSVSAGYLKNPFHNFFHGVGVMHIVYMLLLNCGFNEYFEPIDKLACLTGALCHDIDHPGYTNLFEVNSKSELAILYNDKSVLEMHHAAFASRLMSKEKNNFLREFDEAEHKRFRGIFVGSILSTDMAYHYNMIKDVKELDHEPKKDDEKDRMLLATIMLHCADLSNPVLPEFKVVEKWAIMVCEEFTNQVKKEKSLGLPFAPHMDNLDKRGAIEKMQVGFIDYVVSPLWVAVADHFTKVQYCVDNLKKNRQTWFEKVNAATAATEGEVKK